MCLWPLRFFLTFNCCIDECWLQLIWAVLMIHFLLTFHFILGLLYSRFAIDLIPLTFGFNLHLIEILTFHYLYLDFNLALSILRLLYSFNLWFCTFDSFNLWFQPSLGVSFDFNLHFFNLGFSPSISTFACLTLACAFNSFNLWLLRSITWACAFDLLILRLRFF